MEIISLASRKRQLLLKGIIMDFHDDYKRFAVDFGKLSASGQRKLLRMLDDQESGSEGDSNEDAAADGNADGGAEE